MRRWLVVLVVLAGLVACALPAAAVDLTHGWQMVSFSILEPKLLDDFDVINQTTSERRTFTEASGPGGWVDYQLWGYEPALQSYAIVGLGQQIEPEHGYWLYVYSSDPLSMVPTYRVSDYFPVDVGYSALFERISDWPQGTHWVSYDVAGQVDTCGFLTSRIMASVMPLGGGDVLDWWCNRFGYDGQELVMAAFEETDPAITYLDPPLRSTARVYSGQTDVEPMTAGTSCADPMGVPVTATLRWLGPELLRTAQGDLVCLKVEFSIAWPDEVTRSVEWYAPGIGRVRSLDWEAGHLTGASDLVSGPG